MSKMKKIFLPLLLMLALLLAACGGEEATPEPEPTEEPAAEATEEPMEEATEEPMAEETIVDVAVANGNFNTLVTAVEAAGLAETLSGEGPFTVFAPTDDAFAALPEGTLDALLADPDGALTDILLYHVVEGEVPAADVVNLDSFETLNGEMVSVAVEGENVILNGEVTVTMTDIEASNGIIHVIDAVLLPPDQASASDIVETAIAADEFNTLVTAVEAAGLVETLQGEGPFTVFAPTDAAFEALGEDTINSLLADPETLAEILTYHVVEGAVFAADVTGLESATTVQGDDITITVEDGNVILNGVAQVIQTDIEASNGVIHVIDAVLLPPAEEEPAEEAATENIVETAAAAGTFNTLLTAATEAGLAETLSGEGPFTVFAPTDDAFAALPEGTLDALLEDPEALANILLYHVIEGEVFAEDVLGLDIPVAASANGAPILFDVREEGVFISDSQNEAQIVTTDIQASNGVIHVIDAVILPPEGNIVETAVASEEFNTLVTAVETAGLVDALSGEEYLTVFAPTDAAFAALGDQGVNLDDVLADTELLTTVLLYHVAEGALPANYVVAQESLPTLAALDVTITVTDEGVFLNDTVQVVITNIVTTNGVIHAIDAVLLPPQ